MSSRASQLPRDLDGRGSLSAADDENRPLLDSNKKKAPRLVSLDVFRGLTIIGMVNPCACPFLYTCQGNKIINTPL